MESLLLMRQQSLLRSSQLNLLKTWPLYPQHQDGHHGLGAALPQLSRYQPTCCRVPGPGIIRQLVEVGWHDR